MREYQIESDKDEPVTNASSLYQPVRQKKQKPSGFESFLKQQSVSSKTPQRESLTNQLYRLQVNEKQLARVKSVDLNKLSKPATPARRQKQPLNSIRTRLYDLQQKVRDKSKPVRPEQHLHANQKSSVRHKHSVGPCQEYQLPVFQKQLYRNYDMPGFGGRPKSPEGGWAELGRRETFRQGNW